MPYRRRFSTKMTDYDDDITVVDVYDLASDIGKECEIIIEKYGPDAVTGLLPKVINSLELLENLAVRNEKENQALLELTAKISQLENDKIEKAEYRQRFEKVSYRGHCLIELLVLAWVNARNISFEIYELIGYTCNSVMPVQWTLYDIDNIAFRLLVFCTTTHWFFTFIVYSREVLLDIKSKNPQYSITL